MGDIIAVLIERSLRSFRYGKRIEAYRTSPVIEDKATIEWLSAILRNIFMPNDTEYHNLRFIIKERTIKEVDDKVAPILIPEGIVIPEDIHIDCVISEPHDSADYYVIQGFPSPIISIDIRTENYSIGGSQYDQVVGKIKALSGWSAYEIFVEAMRFCAYNLQAVAISTGGMADFQEKRNKDKLVEKTPPNLEDLGLSVRCYNAIRRSGINDTNALLEALRKGLSIRGLGAAGLSEVKNSLRRFNINIGESYINS
ncbi:MAG: hypothetical protein NZM04_09450 [Methylacidiphilales bacterium]|nr:hypothetical protein [Candidatus Methylacidiphilales bacterium]